MEVIRLDEGTLLKSVNTLIAYWGFESLCFRNCKPTLSWFLVAQILETANRKIGRVAYRSSFENYRTVMYRGFKSFIFRKTSRMLCCEA